MSRTPLISICRRCEDDEESEAGNGELLYQEVKALRKKLGLKEVFDVEGVRCLGMCRSPCNVMFEGKPHVARLIPQPDANGVWQLKLVMTEAKGAVAEAPKAAKPKAAATFKTAEVEKTVAEPSRLDKLESLMALVLERLPQKA